MAVLLGRFCTDFCSKWRRQYKVAALVPDILTQFYRMEQNGDMPSSFIIVNVLEWHHRLVNYFIAFRTGKCFGDHVTFVICDRSATLKSVLLQNIRWLMIPSAHCSLFMVYMYIWCSRLSVLMTGRVWQQLKSSCQIWMHSHVYFLSIIIHFDQLVKNVSSSKEMPN